MKAKTLIALSFVFLFSFPFSFVFGTTFSRNLKQGDQGDDVFALQKVLNTNQVTQVSLSGAGSPGQETLYFGRLTTLAVIRFQKLYGISPAVGFVGPLTRQKINGLSQITVPTIPNPPLPTATALSSTTIAYLNGLVAQYSHSTSSAVKISSFTPSIATLTGKVTISGSGFTSDKNLLFTPFGSIENLVSTNNGQNIEFSMSNIPLLKVIAPSGFDITKLRSFNLPVSISNSNGTSGNALLPLSF